MDISNIVIDDGKTVHLRDEARRFTEENPITCSKKILEQLFLLDSMSNTDSGVLIIGEPGTGKEEYAEYIYRKSTRADKPYMRFNCSATSEAVFSKEFFGAKDISGVFGTVNRPGILQKANGGILLLQAFTTIPQSQYSKVCELLQKKPIFSDGTPMPDIKIIATTCYTREENLKRDHECIRLFNAFNALQIYIPPLRERPEDIALKTLYNLETAGRRYGNPKTMGSHLFNAIMNRSWTGNERELEAFINKLILSPTGEILDNIELISYLTGWDTPPAVPISTIDLEDYIGEPEDPRSLKEIVSDFEVALIKERLAKYDSLRKAAKSLKVDASVLSRKLAAAKKNQKGE